MGSRAVERLDKYTRRNTQREIHKEKYTRRNPQGEVHKKKYTRRNTKAHLSAWGPGL